MNYEAARPYPVDVQLKSGTDCDNRETWRVEKMRWRSKTDRDAIIYNGKVIVTGMPEQAHDWVAAWRGRARHVHRSPRPRCRGHHATGAPHRSRMSRLRLKTIMAMKIIVAVA